MKKLKVDGKFIDIIVNYLNEILNNTRYSCGVCDAMTHLVGPGRAKKICSPCPLFEGRQGISCANRSLHLRTPEGYQTHNYDIATQESKEARVQWIANQVNKHIISDWEIYIE